MNARLRWRKLVSGFMLTMTGVCALVAVSVLFFILGYFVYNGGMSINWDFFTKLPTQVGETGGGMANAIVGSAKLLLLASLIGVPIGFFGGIYLAEFSGTKVAFVVRYAADLLNGVPRALREGSMALGAGKWTTIMRVVVPAAYRGIMTAILLALARVAGETAPLLFTALGNQYWSPGWNQPTASLPVVIYNYALSPYEDWHRQAWAGGLVLLGLILMVNIVARVILSRGIAVPRS